MITMNVKKSMHIHNKWQKCSRAPSVSNRQSGVRHHGWPDRQPDMNRNIKGNSRLMKNIKLKRWPNIVRSFQVQSDNLALTSIVICPGAFGEGLFPRQVLLYRQLNVLLLPFQFHSHRLQHCTRLDKYTVRLLNKQQPNMTVSYVQITHLVPKEFESQISRK